jgi:hypothetical protein
MAPTHIIMTSEPRVSPMPFCTDLVIESRGIPISRPVSIDTIRNARKGLHFPHVMSRTSKRMQQKTMKSDMKLVEANQFDTGSKNKT